MCTPALFGAAFCWDATPEGDSYWRKLDAEYQKWYFAKTYDKFDLYRFLEARHSLSDFLENTTCSIDDWAPEGFISGAFAWDSTKQGHNYWHHLNEAWQAYIKA